ncbi:hypothetical protein H696_01225 [Fonticula alba]|uniref:Nudix hydrolase domain-containing protein n=1 Tax=Fonticula alba TaxID=691883 RepID=A0A058ZEC3_FONAL|nr:hypothetical protein H696_01225 [Fonticula alba]KCV71807.1 hypothetical protein H696_01225 [Fonticula alba]|eukprot:XP_009493385.1 hypothetical protein H696_01225 [Fonticula alba]
MLLTRGTWLSRSLPALRSSRRPSLAPLAVMSSTCNSDHPWPCPTCKQWRTPSLTVDAGVLRQNEAASLPADRLEVLLIERANPPFKGCWAFPGGFLDYGEAPERAVLRELEEECGIVPDAGAAEPRLLAAAGAPDRDPRRHTVTLFYGIDLGPTEKAPVAGDDAAKAQWIPVARILGSGIGDLPEGERLRLAFDHQDLLARLLDFHHSGKAADN